MAQPLRDPDANLWLLTGDDWAPWLVEAVNAATESLHLSIYMISHHWRNPDLGNLNPVQALKDAALRGLTCRCVIDQPNVVGRLGAFNVTAAADLQRAGWKVRVMPDARTLHEKILVIDKRLSLVGSHNISKASATSNYDTSLAVESTALAERLHRQFWERWRAASPLKV